MMSRAFYIVRHGVIFALAKSAVLISPLLAASILLQSQYGSVEWWLALSLAIGPLISVGASGVIAYGSVGGELKQHVRTASIFVLVIATILIAFALVLQLFGLTWHECFLGPVAMQCAIVALQQALSARLKALGRGAWASVVESALYICLLCALCMKLYGFDFVNAFVLFMLLASAILMIGVVRTVSMPRVGDWHSRNYWGFLRVGVHFMAAGSLMGLFMATPRISLGVIASSEMVAVFALAFRWLSVVIVVHQFINTIFFRQLFAGASVQVRDKALAATVAGVAFFSIFVVLLFYWVNYFNINIPLKLPESYSMVWSMAIAMVLWSATACIEGSLYREAASSRQLQAVAVGVVVQTIIIAVLYFTALSAVQVAVCAWIFGLIIILFMQMRGLQKIGSEMPILFRTTFFSVIFIAAMMALSSD